MLAAVSASTVAHAHLMDIVAAASIGMSSGRTCSAVASKTADCLQVPAPASRGTTSAPSSRPACMHSFSCLKACVKVLHPVASETAHTIVTSDELNLFS